MHQLPATLLLGLLESLHLVVAGDLLVQGAQHDHGDHSGEEENDHERVDDGEVVDLVVGVALQIHIPAVGPGQVGALPLNVVGVDNVLRLDLNRLELVGIEGGGVLGIAGGQHRCLLLEVRLSIVILVLQTKCVHLNDFSKLTTSLE
jgi:hypothetical protein